MRLLVGLGNPGPRYARNRHNIGFLALDAIGRRYGFGAARSRFDSLIAEGRIVGETVLALKPQTYMNESGRAVGAAMRYRRLAPEDVIVLHDDLDLLPGKVRVKTGGGAGGHNGLTDIDAHIGRDYVRVRLGIGRPADKHRVTAYVLSDFAKADAEWFGPVIEAVAEAMPLLIAGDAPGFMSRVAYLAPPPKPPEPESSATSEGGKT